MTWIKKIFKRECDHFWLNYRHRWVEYMPNGDNKTNPYSREGAYILSHVYCADCGEVREVINDNNKIRFRQIP